MSKPREVDLGWFSGRVMIVTNVMRGQHGDANCMHIMADGKVFTVVEDPNDGYRSSLDSVYITSQDPKEFPNAFECEVTCVRVDNDSTDIVRMVDLKTKKTVVEFGTNYTDSYYPYFVDVFDPKAMACNQKGTVERERLKEVIETSAEEMANRPSNWGTW